MSSSLSMAAMPCITGSARLPDLNSLQLLDQVFGVLLRQLGVDGDGGVAIGRVAGGAHRGVAGLALGQVRLGGLRRG